MKNVEILMSFEKATKNSILQWAGRTDGTLIGKIYGRDGRGVATLDLIPRGDGTYRAKIDFMTWVAIQVQGADVPLDKLTEPIKPVSVYRHAESLTKAMRCKGAEGWVPTDYGHGKHGMSCVIFGKGPMVLGLNLRPRGDGSYVLSAYLPIWLVSKIREAGINVTDKPTTTKSGTARVRSGEPKLKLVG